MPLGGSLSPLAEARQAFRWVCRSAHRLPRAHVRSFCCAYCATAMSFLPVQGMGYPAACATLIRAASARVRIGSSVPGAIWHARCAEALAWRSKCVYPLSGPRSWTTAFPHALWHGSVCCIRCTHLPPVLSAARCLRLVSLLVGRPSRGIGGTERSATSPLPTPACSRLRFLVLLQDSPHHEGCILCLRVRRRAYRSKSM